MLSLLSKRVLVSIHIFLISLWIGTLVNILLLHLLKQQLYSVFQIEILDKIVFTLFDSIIINVSIAVAISGLLFSIYTNWGFVKFYWIMTKWALLLLLAIMIIFLASPAINGMASFSDVFKENVLYQEQYLQFENQSFLYIVIQLVTLILIVFISVFKPWGQRRTNRKMNRKIVVSSGIIILLILISMVILQYIQLTHYRNLKINEINLQTIDDGRYVGKVDYAFEYEIEVYIMNHTIKDIKILRNRDSHYARLAEGIKYKVLREQKINIDSVTGATTTSQILLKAMEAAIVNPTK